MKLTATIKVTEEQDFNEFSELEKAAFTKDKANNFPIAKQNIVNDIKSMSSCDTVVEVLSIELEE